MNDNLDPVESDAPFGVGADSTDGYRVAAVTRRVPNCCANGMPSVLEYPANLGPYEAICSRNHYPAHGADAAVKIDGAAA
jgi:hypothetical protein